jgi:hypothetical protein
MEIQATASRAARAPAQQAAASALLGDLTEPVQFIL